MVLPDYKGGGIANLMASLGAVLTGQSQGYAPANLLPVESLEAVDNVVLWVIDGLGYQQLHRQLPDGALARYCRGSMTSVCPTTTASAIPTFLTGVPPLQHGLTGWFTYFGELGAVVTVLPFTFRLGQTPIEAKGFTPAAMSGVDSLFEKLNMTGNVVMPSWIASSSFNRAFCGPARVRPYKNLHGLVKNVQESIGSSRQPSYTYAYWAEYDAIAHTHGCDSKQAIAHLKDLDRAFETLLSSLRGSNTKLLVTADHGFVDSPESQTIRLQDHPKLADTLVVPLCGEPRLAYCYVHADRVAQFKDYIDGVLDHCCQWVSRQEMLDQNWFGLGDAHPRVADRIGHYALVMKDNYKMTGSLPGERSLKHIGVHGGLSKDEMMVPLVIADL